MKDYPNHQQPLTKSPIKRSIVGIFIILFGLGLLVISMIASILFGAAEIELTTIWQSIVSYDVSLTSHQVVYELRIPRTLAAVAVGACLSVSGAIMQGVTRNPLASPSIMGISAGAAFMIALAFAFFPGTTSLGLMLSAFIGAGLGTTTVFGLSAFSRGGLSPVKLALAGTAISAFLQSLSSAIAIHFDVARDISFWFAGGVAGTRWATLEVIIPVVTIGLIGAMVLSRSITILSLSEEVAIGLGVEINHIRILAILVVLLLTGAAVSIAGTIGFVGLVIPHITRFLVGADYRWIIPCSAILGALLLVLADIGARMINPPFETPVGTMTALIGVPFLLYLARKGGNN
ncbi:iron complex transport system permease protein [Amphibacillus marinus]|uniref:Iron complex transport system permease protein n=1 Tax=Amphibacillus marinus TaxID=872970 RepID=A0A1H8LQJ0_9BACI|nr:iron ABC transporter permease [Amphibacillus marinus]SEO07333.1 iron complex transport system permease protein [Amphibacillus marinus]